MCSLIPVSLMVATVNIFLVGNKTLSASLMHVKDQTSQGIQKVVVQPLESHTEQMLRNMQVEKATTRVLLWLHWREYTDPG